METTMFFPLLLLMCSTSTAQLQTKADNQSLPHGEQTEAQRREPTSASDRQQQACPQDIHAVLREMSSSLAEQRVEMRLLQRENEAHADKLRELESQKTEMENQLKAKLNGLELQLKDQLRDKQVAFYVSLLDSGAAYLGPFNTRTHLIFRRVITNIGGAYNPNLGSFIAPVKGAYHFEFHIAGGHGTPAVAGLVKNRDHICIAWEHQNNFGSSANGATLLLETGDVVFLRQWANSKIYDNQDSYSTFSGHLLFTM